jgi:hypothetical protein
VARSNLYSERLNLLKATLQIFLYRHPVDNSIQIMDVIDNAESTGEINLLLEYILAKLVRRRFLPGASPSLDRIHSGAFDP